MVIFKRAIKKCGNGLACTIPKEVVNNLKLKKKEEVMVSMIYNESDSEFAFKFKSFLKVWGESLAFPIKGEVLKFIKHKPDYIWDIDIKKVKAKQITCPHCKKKFLL